MIRKARRLKGLSQRQLANLLGVSQSYISKLENRNIATVTIECILNLSRILNLCPVNLFVFLSKCCDNCCYKQQCNLK